MKKRLLCGLLACLLFLASCGEETGLTPVASLDVSSVSDNKTVYDSFRLPYNTTASFDPAATDSSLNLALLSLVAEPLALPNGDGTAAPVLASDILPSDDFLSFTVLLSENVLFSDKTVLTASDVAASAERIRANRKSAFYSRLSNVAEVLLSEDGESITFTLLSPDPCFACMLSFPVMKQNEDGTFLGTGPYLLSYDENGAPFLLANTAYRDGTPKTKRIELVGTDNAASLHYMLSAGTVDAYYTEHPAKTSGSFSASECLTPTEGFLVFRGETGLCADTTFCKLLLNELDREMLLTDSDLFASPSVRMQTLYRNTGASRAEEPTDPTETLSPEPTQTPSPEETQTPEPPDTTLPASLADYFLQNGYDRVDTEGYRCKAEGETASLTLACLDNKEALAFSDALIKQMQALGIRLEVIPCESTAALSSSRTDLLFAEITFAPDMELSPLLSLLSDGSLKRNYERYRTGHLSGDEFNDILQNEAPFAFLYTRKGRLLYGRSFSEDVKTNTYCPYQKIQNWYLYD